MGILGEGTGIEWKIPIALLRKSGDDVVSLILNFNPPQGWLFLLAVRHSLQALSALAPQRRLNFEF